MRSWYELKSLSFDDFTLDEKKWYCQTQLKTKDMEKYKHWHDVYMKLINPDALTYDEVIEQRIKESTPTKNYGDNCQEREYRGY